MRSFCCSAATFLPAGSAKNKQHRVLLGISKCKSRCVLPPSGGNTYDSVPDAWIYGDGFAVLVESKANGDFSPGQMQAHLGSLRQDGREQPSELRTTWARIHSMFREYSLLPVLTDVARFIIGQFIQFLEYSGMSGFANFKLEHFSYFLLHDDDDARRWIRE